MLIPARAGAMHPGTALGARPPQHESLPAVRSQTRYNPGMSERDRSVALTTACDDLQAQLEAGNRNMRHLDHELELLREGLHTAFVHAERLGNLERHMREMRANMRDQRDALREIRRAARLLGASVAQARESVASLAKERGALERSHAALPADQERLQGTPANVSGDEAHAEELRDHRTALDEFRKHLMASHPVKPDPAT